MPSTTYLFGLIDQRDSVGVDEVVEVLLQLGLAIDRHVLAGQSLEIDAQHLAGVGQIHSFVDEALGIHALADPRLPQDLGAPVLDDPGPHPLQHVLTGAKLEDDAVDPAQVEEMGEERARPARLR